MEKESKRNMSLMTKRKKKREEQKRVKWKSDVKGQTNKMLLTLAVGL